MELPKYNGEHLASISKLAFLLNLGPLLDLRICNQGYDNLNLIGSFSSRKVIFRRSVALPFEGLIIQADMLDLLTEKGVPVCKRMRWGDNQSVMETPTGTWVVLEFIEGIHPPLTPETARQIGRYQAKLHLALPQPIWKEESSGINQDIINVGEQIKNAPYSLPGIYDFFATQVSDFDFEENPDLPKGMCHSDLFPSNVIFKGEKLAAIIDWDDFRFDTYVYDIGMSILGYCFPNNTFSLPMMEQFLESYNSFRPLTTEERESIPHNIRKALLWTISWHLQNKLMYDGNNHQKKRVEELIECMESLSNPHHL